MDISNAITLTIVAAPAVSGNLPTWASDANLPPGEVRPISRNNIADAWEGPQPGGSGNVYKAVAAWTSGIDAPLLGQFGSKIWSGGGDADGWDTAVFAFDYGTQLWSRIKNRTQALGWDPVADKALPAGHPYAFDRSYCEHGDGTPAAPHTYDLLDYLPPDAGGGAMGAMCRPVSRFMYTIDSTNHAHKFTFEDKRWTRAAVAPCGTNANALGMAAYDPTSKRLWVLPSTSTGFWADALDYLDFSSGVGVPGRVPLGKDFLIQSGTMRFWRQRSSRKRYLVILGHRRLSLIDLDLPSNGVANVALSSAFDELGYPGSGFAEVVPLNCFFALGADAGRDVGAIYKITPPANDAIADTWLVERIIMRGAPPINESANGIWKRFHYVESLRALTWFYAASGPVYAYRPAGILHCGQFGQWDARCAGPGFAQFDWERYLRSNPDVDAYVGASLALFSGSRFRGAAWHYVVHGAWELRPAFDWAGQPISVDRLLDRVDWPRYLTENVDVASYVDAHLEDFFGSRANGAIWHYSKFGVIEARSIFNEAGIPDDLHWLVASA